jgi:hypothetical protein
VREGAHRLFGVGFPQAAEGEALAHRGEHPVVASITGVAPASRPSLPDQESVRPPSVPTLARPASVEDLTQRGEDLRLRVGAHGKDRAHVLQDDEPEVAELA